MAAFAIPCPFVYASGKPCAGSVCRAQGYGRVRGDHYVIRKYRLWCSEKDDHAGAVRTFEGKQRMEFYPDELPPGMLDRIQADDLLG